MRDARSTVVAVLLFVTPAPLACVTREHRELREVREVHQRCVEEHAAEHPDCMAAAEQVRVTETRYHDQARRSWGCSELDPKCPAER